MKKRAAAKPDCIRGGCSRRSESLMIGDSWEADIIGAHNSKIDQLWLNPKGLPAKEFIPTYTVGSLEEIKRIL